MFPLASACVIFPSGQFDPPSIALGPVSLRQPLALRHASARDPKPCPGLRLSSQLITPPNYNYLNVHWSGPTLYFVSFLVGVKQWYDQQDLFRFAQSTLCLYNVGTSSRFVSLLSHTGAPNTR